MKTNGQIKQYFLNDTLDGKVDVITKPIVQLFNNEQIVIDFTDLTFNCSEAGINGVELLKVKIDWGDGYSDILNKHIVSVSSTIGTIQQMNWKKVSHKFNSEKKNVYLTDDVHSLPKISLTFYNTFNDKTVINIPYKLIYKSFYDLTNGIKLMSGSVSNDNHSSFVLKNNRDNALFVISVKDWKKIYGQDEILYINDSHVSEDYSDEYIAQDSTVWQWNETPRVSISKCEVKTGVYGGKTVTYFHCQVEKKQITFDSWTPYCYFLGENGQEKMTEIDGSETAEKFVFKIFNFENKKDAAGNIIQKTYKNLQDGIYKIYVQVLGVNGLKASSQPLYVKNDESIIASDKIIAYNGQFVSKNESEKVVVLRYTLPPNANPNHLEYAKMYLSSSKYDKSNNGLGTVFEEGEHIVFEYDLDFSEEAKKNGGSYYEMRIPFSNIPNGSYQMIFEIKELSKSENEPAQQTIYKWQNDNLVSAFPTDASKIIDIKYTNIGQINIDRVQVKDRNFIVKWNVSNPSQMSKIMYRLTKVVGDNNVERYVIDKNQNYTNWNPTHTNNVYSFSETLPCHVLADGNYKIEVSHIIPMSQYLGQRYKLTEYTYSNYKYPAPELTIKNVIPFLKKSGGNYIPYYRVYVNPIADREVQDVEVKYSQKNYKKCQNYVCQINQDSVTTNLSARGYDSQDSTYKRKQETPAEIVIEEKKQLNNDLRKVLGQIEKVEKGKLYVNEKTQRVVDGETLISQTSYCLKKDYKWTSPYGDQYYSIGNTQYYVINGDKKYILFKGQNYYQQTDKNNTIYRYRPNNDEIDMGTLTSTKLQSVQDYLKNRDINVSKVYDKDRDAFTVIVKFNQAIYQNDKKQVEDMFVTLTEKNGTSTRKHAIKDLNATFYGMQAGKYTVDVQFHSSNTENVTTSHFIRDYNSLQSLIFNFKPEQIFQYSHFFTPNYSQTHKWLNVQWKCYHKDIKNIQLRYVIEQQVEKVTVDSKGEEIITMVWETFSSSSQNFNSRQGTYEVPVLIPNKCRLKYWFVFDSTDIDWSGAEDANNSNYFPYKKDIKWITV